MKNYSFLGVFLVRFGDFLFLQIAKLSLEEELHKVKAARSVDDLQRYEKLFIFRRFFSKIW